jgi:ribosome maturation factor RimP
MIDKIKIEQLVNEVITDDFFIVEIKISASNKINVYIDSIEGASIEDCIKISRNIENNLDRETEDFELEVSTPGLDGNFKVPQQYIKNIGKTVETLFKNGLKIKGQLTSYKNNEIELLENKMIKPENKKKKEKVEITHRINLSDIISTKIVISFK